jgi:hypothetical protein
MSKPNWEEKVRFLLNKAASTEFPAEKEECERKAFELIHKYGLNLDKIKSTPDKPEKIVHLVVDFVKNDYTPGDWRMYLMGCVSMYTGVYAAFGHKSLHFFADEAHAKLAVDVYELWEKELLNKCDAEAKQFSKYFYSQKNLVGIHRRVWRGQFMYSACVYLANRVEAMMKILDKTTTALVIDRREHFKNSAQDMGHAFSQAEARRREVMQSAAKAGEKAARELDIQKKLK